MGVRPFAFLGLAAALAFGCASTQVVQRDEYKGGKLPRPGRIIVHNFAASPGDLPAWVEVPTGMATAAKETSQEDLEDGRTLGIEVARSLVGEIVEMGLPAVRAPGERAPEKGDLLVGYFATIDEGSALKRVTIGFGSGGADLQTHVEAHRMAGGRLQKLGSGDLDSGPSKGPGVVVPAIVTIATANPVGLAVGGAAKAAGEVTGSSTIEGAGKRTAKKIAEELRPKFQEQGWIE